MIAAPAARRDRLANSRRSSLLLLRACRLAIIGVLLALLALLAPSVGRTAEPNHAGVVLRDANGGLTYAYVAFPEEEIGGIELLRRTGLPLVTAGFGGLGEAVCSVAGEGCGLAECRRNVCQGAAAAPYWRYFRQDSAGDWQPLPLGASSARVRNGDIDGWSWTADEAELPPLTLAELAYLAGVVEVAGAAVSDPMPTAAIRGAAVAAAPPATTESPAAYVVAAAMLVAIGGGALVLGRRGARAMEAP